jgi:hypothetical protein
MKSICSGNLNQSAAPPTRALGWAWRQWVMVDTTKAKPTQQLLVGGGKRWEWTDNLGIF